MNYQKQANTFAQKHRVKLSVIGNTYGKHFADDKVNRYIFNLRLARKRKQYTFKFGQSIASGAEEPTMYDILSCLQKYDVGTFEDFCGDFGYNADSISAHRTYKGVCKEYAAVERLFGDIIEELQEIQ